MTFCANDAASKLWQSDLMFMAAIWPEPCKQNRETYRPITSRWKSTHAPVCSKPRPQADASLDIDKGDRALRSSHDGGRRVRLVRRHRFSTRPHRDAVDVRHPGRGGRNVRPRGAARLHA